MARGPKPKPRPEPPPPPKLRRKTCLNCGTLFWKTRPNRKFCGDTCKADWHNTGGVSFAKYSAAVETRVTRAEKAISAQLERFVTDQVRAAESRINENIRTRQQTIMRLLKRIRVPGEILDQMTREADALRAAALQDLKRELIQD